MTQDTFKCVIPKNLTKIKIDKAVYPSSNDAEIYEDATTQRWYVKRADERAGKTSGLMEWYGSVISRFYLPDPDEILLCNGIAKFNQVAYTASREIKNFTALINLSKDSLYLFHQASNLKAAAAFALFHGGQNNLEDGNIGVTIHNNRSYAVNLDFQNFFILRVHLFGGNDEKCYKGIDEKCYGIKQFLKKGYDFGDVNFNTGDTEFVDWLLKFAEITRNKRALLKQNIYEKFYEAEWYFNVSKLSIPKEVDEYIQFPVEQEKCVEKLLNNSETLGELYNYDHDIKRLKVKLFARLNKGSQKAFTFYRCNKKLHKQIANPNRERKLGKRCTKDYELNKIFDQEGLDYEQFKQKSITSFPIYINTDECRIPLRSHIIVLMSKKDSEQEQVKKFYEDNKYLEENLEKTKHWEHFVWTIDVDSIPSNVTKYLDEKNITLVSVNTLQVFAKTSSPFKDLLLAAMQFDELGEFIMAVNLLKYLILQEMGGLYIDGGYKLLNVKVIEWFMSSYDSFFWGAEGGYNVGLDTGLLAAAPYHPVIEGGLNLINRNILDQGNTLNYVKYPCTNITRIIVATGSVVLSVSFAKHADLKNDILLPYSCLNIPPEHQIFMRLSSFCEASAEWEKDNAGNICEEIQLPMRDFTPYLGAVLDYEHL